MSPKSINPYPILQLTCQLTKVQLLDFDPFLLVTLRPLLQRRLERVHLFRAFMLSVIDQSINVDTLCSHFACAHTGIPHTDAFKLETRYVSCRYSCDNHVSCVTIFQTLIHTGIYQQRFIDRCNKFNNGITIDRAMCQRSVIV